MKMHTNRKDMRFGAQLSCKMSKGAHFDCAVSAGKLQDFYSKILNPGVSSNTRISMHIFVYPLGSLFLQNPSLPYL